MSINDLAAWLDTDEQTFKAKPPKRRPDTRPRKHLLPAEFAAMLRAARASATPARDVALCLVAYRHGLRKEELRTLQWSQIDDVSRTLAVQRSKGGIAATHPLQADTLAALRKLRRNGPYVFAGAHGEPISARTVHGTFARLSVAAGLPLTVNPHMMRHGCGYALAAAGAPTRTIQLYLGHRSIQSTARYTAMAPDAFKGLWE